MQVYQTNEDEGIFECPMSWGSNARVRVSARLKLGPFVLYIPIEVCNLQVRPSQYPPSGSYLATPPPPPHTLHQPPKLSSCCPMPLDHEMDGLPPQSSPHPGGSMSKGFSWEGRDAVRCHLLKACSPGVLGTIFEPRLLS